MPLASIGKLQCGASQPLMLIAGPCVLEDLDLALEIARRIRDVCEQKSISFVFKASFDKANRTSLSSFRGPGIEEGLRILRQVRDRVDVPVTTDIHEPDQAAKAAQVCDLLQIPAFLARQTNLLVAAASTSAAVNVKKGQFMAPNDMQHVVHKLRESGARNILVCERGTFFGYGRLVNDMCGLVEMRRLGVPVIFDATHSVQQPGGATTGGRREFVPYLARAAAAVGIDGLFLEAHPRPGESPSDGPNMLTLDELPTLLDQVLAVRRAIEP